MNDDIDDFFDQILKDLDDWEAPKSNEERSLDKKEPNTVRYIHTSYMPEPA